MVESREFFAAELFVAFFNFSRRLGFEAAEDFEKLCRVEGFEMMVGGGTTFEAWSGDYDDWNHRLKKFDFLGDFVAGDVVEAAVEDDATDGWKTGEDFESFLAAIGREDVELGGFDHKLAGRNTAGKLPVDD